MNHTQFFALIKAQTLSACYLFQGEEEYIKQSALAALRSAVLPAGLETLNEAVLENPSADDIIAACETVPFMADRRLVVAKSCGFLSGKGKDSEAELSRLQKYLGELPPHALLIFYVRGMADGRKKICATLKSQNAIVTFDLLDEPSLVKWIRQTLKPTQKTMADDTARYFIFSVGRDTALLKGELQKLAAHAGESGEITKEDIDLICAKSIECTVFELTDEIAFGHTARAMTLLYNLLKTDSERIMLLQMILRQYRILYHLTLMLKDGMPQEAIQKALGIPSFAVQKARRQAAAYTETALKDAVTLIMETDLKIKSGKISQEGVPENIILTLGMRLQLSQG